MRSYDFFTLGERDKYGQQKLNDTPSGTIKIAIFTTGQSVQDNILYSSAQYMGLTQNKQINDSWVIDYNGVKLKVLYVSSQGRLNQVFMAKIG